jgi:putative SOS response-associated peptidase YedK
MPSILKPEHEDRWLSKTQLNAEALNEILAPFPAENMSMFPVSPRVNSPDADDERILRPVNTLQLTEDTDA